MDMESDTRENIRRYQQQIGGETDPERVRIIRASIAAEREKLLRVMKLPKRG